MPLSRPKRNIARDFSDGKSTPLARSNPVLPAVRVFFVTLPRANEYSRARGGALAYERRPCSQPAICAGVLMAETVHHFYPKLVELHNYSAANAFAQKLYNWTTLNKKAMKRLGIALTQAELEDVCNCVPMALEKVLAVLYRKVNEDRNRLDHGASPKRSARGPPSSGHPHRKPPLTSPARAQEGERPHASPSNRKHAPFPADGPRGLSRGGGGAVGPETLALQREVDTEILIEKEQTIQELRETVDILETKVWRWRKVFVVVHAAVCALVPMHAHAGEKAGAASAAEGCENTSAFCAGREWSLGMTGIPQPHRLVRCG